MDGDYEKIDLFACIVRNSRAFGVDGHRVAEEEKRYRGYRGA